MTASSESPESRLTETLRGLDYCIEHAERPEGITIGAVVDHLSSASFCFISLLLATPFIQPLSLGPLTMASGGVFILVGLQMARGNERMNLPARARAWHLRGILVKVLKFCRWLLVQLSRLTRPRLTRWVDGERGSKNIGWLILIGGALLAVPTGNLPFNNTLPALMIFFAALAWLERDGLMAIISILWGGLTLVYFAATASLIFWIATHVWQWLVSWWQ